MKVLRLTPVPLAAFALCAASLTAQSSAPPDNADTIAMAPFDVHGVRDRGFVPTTSAAGTKTPVRLLEAPQSISVIGAEQIAVQGAQGLDEAVRYSSGIVGGAYGPDSRSDWLNVRGFQPTLYLDGLALPDGTWSALSRVEPFGLERVEVLKGAASALYGQMPPGGLVHLVSKRPLSEPLRELDFTVGSFEQMQAAFDFGGPLTSDGAVLYRLTGLARDSDTFVDHTHDKRRFIAPALSWRLGTETWITLLGRYQEADTNLVAGFLPAHGTLLDNPNGRIPRHRNIGEPEYDRYDKEVASIGYEFEHRINDTWRLRQNLRVTRAEVDHRTVSGLGLDPADQRTLFRYVYTPREDADTFAIDNQVEANFVAGALRHAILAGFDWRDTGIENASGFGSAPSLDLFAPVYGAEIATPADSTHAEQSQTHAGFYVQDQLRFGRWVATLGGRHDRLDTTTENLLAATRTDQSDDRLSARAGANYVFDSGVAPYVGWSTSFQPTIGTDFNGRAFRPTEGEVIEAGVKYQPAGTQTLLTAAVYTSQLENALTVDPEHLFFSVQQGETRVRGLELEARVTPFAGFNVAAAYAYTDARVVETTDAAALDRRVPLVPRHQASLWTDYTLQEGLLAGFGIGGGVRHVGSTYGDAYNAWRAPAYTLVDATAHYEVGNWRFQLNVTNLADKRYVSAVNSEIWSYYGAPRTLAFSTRYRW